MDNFKQSQKTQQQGVEVLSDCIDIALNASEAVINHVDTDTIEPVVETASESAEAVAEGVGDLLDGADDIGVLAVVGIVIAAIAVVGGVIALIVKCFKKKSRF